MSAPTETPSEIPVVAAAPPVLPKPSRTRWQPLRVGLIDLFYYDVEEFWFRDGRLLFRGNNGTGKSKVLALTLPFLLDGDLSPHRVEPDADPKKRMEWNLLLGGEHPNPERLGYTWIEFGRLAEDGSAHFTTLGCGLKAVTGRGIARHWFFVTDRRVGAGPGAGGLRLLDSTGAAVGRERLAEALGDRGMVYDSARSYRRAVDEALFGLGEQRYAALVDLLVQLRQPQLSKRPSERALSQALTESLPPMDQAVIADVAEAFRSLDEEKEQLAVMVAAERAAGGFLGHYRRYARIAARRRARAPRERHSRYETLRTELTSAEQGFEQAERDLEASAERLAALATEQSALRARDEALRAGPEMRSARDLDRARQEADGSRQAAAQAAGDRQRAESELARSADRLGAARTRAEAAERDWDAARAGAAESAEAALVADEHRQRVLDPLTAGDTADSARRAAEGITDRRLRAVAMVEREADAHLEAAREHDRARRLAEDAQSELARRAELRAEAEDQVSARGEDYLRRVRRYFADCAHLRPAAPEEVLDLLGPWTSSLAGPDPARTAVQQAASAAQAELARREAALDAERTRLRDASAEAEAELAGLRAGRTRSPRPPYTRSANAREDRPGAPLWRLVDFAEPADTAAVLTEGQRAGLEAALEASGVLDAWVSPDGTLASPETWDVLLAAGPPVSGRSLAEVLTPAVDRADPRCAAVSDELLNGLLAGVSLRDTGEERTRDVEDPWMSLDGGFRIGPLTGRWRKPAAEYLGAGAREQARRARMAILEAQLTELDATLAEVSAAADRLAADRDALTAEQDAAPDDSALRAAHAAVTAAVAEHDRAAARVGSAEKRATATAAAVERAATTLRDLAGELGLPVVAAELTALRDAISGYRTALAALWPAVRERRAAFEALNQEQADHTRAADHAAELAERARASEEQAVAAAERHETLRSTVGAAVAELERRLAAVAEELRRNRAAEETARTGQAEAIAARARADALRARIAEEIEEAARTRAEAVDALRRFAASGLLAVALPELEHPRPDQEWAPDPAVRVARAVERELEAEQTDDSDPAWERVQRRITEELKELSDALARHGHTATARMLDEGLVVDVVFQGRERSVPELARALAAEVEDRQRLLSAREQEILENHLITEVAGTLQELVSAAEQQVLRMNAELTDRPTSTGMLLRLVWRPARHAPAGLAAARERLLRQSSDAWGRADRSALGGFLQEQIDRARADDPAGTWLEHLTAALDYRAWHEFGIERHQQGRWQSATGPASGGERVLTVSLPLFAAASSHYASARNPHAPRLVTLDEAFAGVDDDSRAKSLGLLAAFDLDVVMTSEREWGCYPQVPGLAIAQLSRVEEIAAVLVTRWEWDGCRRMRASRPEVREAPEPAAPDSPAAPGDVSEVPSATGTLFA